MAWERNQYSIRLRPAEVEILEEWKAVLTLGLPPEMPLDRTTLIRAVLHKTRHVIDEERAKQARAAAKPATIRH